MLKTPWPLLKSSSCRSFCKIDYNIVLKCWKYRERTLILLGLLHERRIDITCTHGKDNFDMHKQWKRPQAVGMFFLILKLNFFKSLHLSHIYHILQILPQCISHILLVSRSVNSSLQVLFKSDSKLIQPKIAWPKPDLNIIWVENSSPNSIWHKLD